METAGVVGDVEYLKSKVPGLTEASYENLAKTARRAVRITLPEKPASEPTAPWKSKVGGLPYLPLDTPWPLAEGGDEEKVPLAFICQVNFGEIDPEWLPDAFPRRGILEWFVLSDDTYGMGCGGPRGNWENADQRTFRVLYFPEVFEDESKLWAREKLLEIGKKAQEPGFLPIQGIDEEHPMSFSPFVQYMTLWDFRRDKVLAESGDLWDNPAAYKAYEELDDNTNETKHQLGGYPIFTQEDPRCGDDDFKNYELLIQLGCSGPVMWGDGGDGHLFIEQAKLKECDFSQTLYYWDCC